MNYGKFSESTNQYELTDGYALERAANREFATHYVVYRNADVDLLLSYEAQCQQLEEMGSLGMGSLFWIRKHGQRIGGVIMRPNYMEGLFLQPPDTDVYGTLKVLKPLLLSWSDRTKDILTSEILPGELEAYHRLGFRTMKMLRYMVRPTERFHVSWPRDLKVISPTKDHVRQIVALLRESFEGTASGNNSVTGHRKNMTMYFRHRADDPPATVASSLVVSRKAKRPVGVCLIRAWSGPPAVSRLAVAPTHRRNGIATKMLKRALTRLRGKYSWLRTVARIGDPAESVYYDLGFMPGVEQTSVYIPAGTF